MKPHRLVVSLFVCISGLAWGDSVYQRFQKSSRIQNAATAIGQYECRYDSLLAGYSTTIDMEMYLDKFDKTIATKGMKRTNLMRESAYFVRNGTLLSSYVDDRDGDCLSVTHIEIRRESPGTLIGMAYKRAHSTGSSICYYSGMKTFLWLGQFVCVKEESKPE